MISYEVRGPVAWLTLDRPEKLNAMTRGFFTELEARVTEADSDPAVRVLVFHGAGKCFSVGGDIEGFGELGGAGDRRAYVQEALRSTAPSRRARSRRSPRCTGTRSAAAAS